MRITPLFRLKNSLTINSLINAFLAQITPKNNIGNLIDDLNLINNFIISEIPRQNIIKLEIFENFNNIENNNKGPLYIFYGLEY